MDSTNSAPANRFTFRVWDKIRGTMIHWGELTDRSDESYLYRALSPLFNGLMPMQSTGLLDTHGKEIFEGDILEFDNDLEPQANGLYELQWNDEYAEWFLIAISARLTAEDAETVQVFFGGEGLNWLSVVGNIYESPELLKP